LTTAIEIDATIEDHLMAMIEKQTHGTLELEKNVDSEILGGFMIEVDNLRWDATLKNELRSIKNKLIENSI
jgi:F-type H+-transporting ATPase subunit delta